MRAPSMAADFGHILISEINADPAVSRGHDPGDLLPCKARLPQDLSQDLLGALPGFGSGAHHRRCHDLSLPVHDHRVGGRGTAVYSHYIHVFLLSFGGRTPLFLSGIQRLQKSLDPCQHLAVALFCVVCLKLEHRPRQHLFQPGVLVGVIVTELDCMVDDAVHAPGIFLYQFISPCRRFHAHAGELPKKPSCVAGHHLVRLQEVFSPKACAGDIKGHIRPLLLQDTGDIFIGPGPHDTDIERMLFQRDGLLFLSGL